MAGNTSGWSQDLLDAINALTDLTTGNDTAIIANDDQHQAINEAADAAQLAATQSGTAAAIAAGVSASAAANSAALAVSLLTASNARPSSATVAVIGLTGVSQVISLSNPNRRIVLLHNNSNAVVFAALGSVCSTSAFTYRIAANERVMIEDFTGPVSAVRTSGTGPMIVTEVLI